MVVAISHIDPLYLDDDSGFHLGIEVVHPSDDLQGECAEIDLVDDDAVGGRQYVLGGDQRSYAQVLGVVLKGHDVATLVRLRRARVEQAFVPRFTKGCGKGIWWCECGRW